MLSDIELPPQCQQVNVQGQPPTCEQGTDGSWNPTYPGPGSGLFSGAAGFIAIAFVVVLVQGVLGTVWRVRMARRIASDAGLDPSTAAALSVLSPHGLEETYLAASLRGGVAQPQPTTGAGDVAQRLRQLRDLKDQGLITEAEFTERRSVLIKDL